MSEDYKNIIKLDQLSTFKRFNDEKYLDKNQTTENKGKILSVGDDGTITPTSVSTIVDDSTLKATDDKIGLNATIEGNKITKIGTYEIGGSSYTEGEGVSINDNNEISVVADDNTIVINDDNKVSLNATIEDNVITKIGSYDLPSGGTPSTADKPVKIFDNDNDEEHQGKLWLYENGTMVLSNLPNNYTDLEIYYSYKGSSQIQYYKVLTELITSPKTNKGMFYIFVPSETNLYSMEQVEVSYDLVGEEARKSITIESLAHENSEIKIERIYGVKAYEWTNKIKNIVFKFDNEYEWVDTMYNWNDAMIDYNVNPVKSIDITQLMEVEYDKEGEPTETPKIEMEIVVPNNYNYNVTHDEWYKTAASLGGYPLATLDDNGVLKNTIPFASGYEDYINGMVKVKVSNEDGTIYAEDFVKFVSTFIRGSYGIRTYNDGYNTYLDCISTNAATNGIIFNAPMWIPLVSGQGIKIVDHDAKFKTGICPVYYRGRSSSIHAPSNYYVRENYQDYYPELYRPSDLKWINMTEVVVYKVGEKYVNIYDGVEYTLSAEESAKCKFIMLNFSKNNNEAQIMNVVDFKAIVKSLKIYVFNVADNTLVKDYTPWNVAYSWDDDKDLNDESQTDEFITTMEDSGVTIQSNDEGVVNE